MKNKHKGILKNVVIFGVLFLYVIFLQKSKIYSPIAYLLKIPMPTTGMTRAWLSLLSGNINKAFNYNALFILAPFLSLSIILYLKTNKRKWLNYSLIMSVILFVYNLFRIFS